MIYLDNNATTKVAPEVAEALWPWLVERYGNPSSLHRAGEEAERAISDARAQVARLIRARSPREIVFTSGGTESDHTALAQARCAGPSRRRIVTTAIEHPAVLEPLEMLAREGFTVEHIGVDTRGALRTDEFIARLDTDVALASAMWVNNETGAIQELAPIAEACRSLGIAFHVDAVQGVGRLPISVANSNIDYLSISAHKLHGPKGVGALFVREGAPFRRSIAGGPQEHNRRAGTENVAGIVGFGRAAQLAGDWLGSGGSARVALLRDRLERAISERVPRARVIASELPRAASTCQLIFGDVSGEALVMALSELGVCASSGSACAAGRHAPSHVLLAMGLDPATASSSLRLSLSRYTTEDEVLRAAELVAQAVGELRSLLGSAHG